MSLSSLPVLAAVELSQIGGCAELLSKERAAAVKKRVRRIVYDADTGKVRIEMIKLSDDSARNEAEATERRAGTEQRRSGRRHR